MENQRKALHTKPTTDPSHDVLRQEKQPLDAIFMPKSVAVIGASETLGSVGRTILWNLINNSFGGTVYPVNPKRPNVLGIKAYPNIATVPEQIDLAIIITPAKVVPTIVGECIDAGVKGAIVISAGFRELGATGYVLEKQIVEQLQRGKMRLIGPNCLGVISNRTGLNATFANAMARPGNVGFISQSGALCTAILDWSLREQVGFSAFVSVGSMLDVGWGDLIYYLGDDHRTQSIVIYMESIGDARSFLSAAREVALTKPIIVIKAGRTDAAAKAAASHTGALTGSDEVLDAAFSRCGVLRVTSIAELFYMAEILAKQPRPKGPRLMVFTNAGGPGVLATDALISNGGELAELSNETILSLNKILPAHWSHNNPIDVLGDASPELYAKAFEIAVKDPSCDGILAILAPQGMTDPTQTAEQVKLYAKTANKPILASWMGGASVMAGAAILAQANIPTFPYPDTAARMFNYMWQYSDNLRSLYETPVLYADSTARASDRVCVEEIIEQARKSGRTILTELESKQLLSAYGIPVVKTYVATNATDAIKLADEIGYPVVVKLFSETVTHKTDVGGVKLNLIDADSVRHAYYSIESSVKEKLGAGNFLGVTVQKMIKLDGYEIILGSSIDPQFGPVLLFGSGGQLVEVYKDHALGLPPLNTTLARRMMEQTRIFTALKGVRGRKPVNIPALEQIMVRFSQLVVEQSWIKEIDINPLLISAEEMIALDARVVLYGADTSKEQLPTLAIRPYPTQYVSQWTMKNGTEVTIRPIRPEDEPLIINFHKTLSEQSVYFRYFNMMSLNYRTSHERLARVCFIDYDREVALVVERKDQQTGKCEIIAVGRLIKLHGTKDAEFAIAISDQFQKAGLGTELLSRLLQIGRDEKLSHITADILLDNRAMQHVSEKLGFRLHYSSDAEVVKAEIAL
ncbi:MAG: bifunctional acetate--CoA ligase family protein/GNAT family N-acetyltransferase [Acidobacteriota bacterium]